MSETMGHEQLSATSSTSFYSRITNLATLSLGKLLLTIVPIAISLAFIVGSIYWFRSSIIQAYYTSLDVIFATLGLGIVPISLFGLVFGCTLIKRPKLLAKFNIWLGSVGIVIFSLGVFAYFQPNQGILSLFTLNGEVSLGGDLGEVIKGRGGFSSLWRLPGLALLSVAILRPSIILYMLALSKLLGSYIYMYLLAIVGYLLKMYFLERDARSSDRDALKINAKNKSVSLNTDSFDENKQNQELRSITDYQSGNRSRNHLTENYTINPLENIGGIRQVHDVNASLSIGEDSADGVHEIETTPSHDVPLVKKFNSLWGRPGTPPINLSDSKGLNKQTEVVHDISTSLNNWNRPSTDLLIEVPEGGITKEEMERTSEVIRETFSEYGIEVKVGQIRPGPAVTMYGLIPGWIRRYRQVKKTDEFGIPVLDETGKPVVVKEETKSRVKVDNILSREKDLALALKTPSIRIETPVMGES